MALISTLFVLPSTYTWRMAGWIGALIDLKFVAGRGAAMRIFNLLEVGIADFIWFRCGWSSGMKRVIEGVIRA